MPRPPGAPLCFANANSHGQRVYDPKSWLCQKCVHAPLCAAAWDTLPKPL